MTQKIALPKIEFALPASETRKREVQGEAVLIQRAKAGDVKAFELIFKKYHLRVLNLAYRIVGDPDCAKDVAQETFLRLYSSIRHFRNEKKFFAWLYRITVNMCYDYLRREKRFQHAALQEETAHIAPDSDRPSANPELIEKIYEMLDRLSTHQKTAFILRESEGLSCKEIARAMDCPVGTARSHLFHARKKLKAIIQMKYPELLEGI